MNQMMSLWFKHAKDESFFNVFCMLNECSFGIITTATARQINYHIPYLKAVSERTGNYCRAEMGFSSHGIFI